VVYDTHNWHLTRQNAKDWKALEKILELAAQQLLSFFRRNHPKTRLSFKGPERPSKYGYFDTHQSESAARGAIALSLDAFAVYLGYFSFLAAICQFGIDTEAKIPSWRKPLDRQDSGVHPEWLKLLAESPIVDFSRERIGVVTDVSRCDWLHLATYMIKASVPLWFSWGKIPYYAQPSQPWISEYFPDFDKFTNVEPTNAGRFPPVQPNSGQHHGETMEQFFARRHKGHAKRKATESAYDRQIRKQREKEQASRPFPGKKGPSVYSWDDVEGFRIRTRVARSRVADLWTTRWKFSEQVYNSFDNCWDCCSLFGDNSCPGEPDPSDSESDDSLFPAASRSADVANPPPFASLPNHPADAKGGMQDEVNPSTSGLSLPDHPSDTDSGMRSPPKSPRNLQVSGPAVCNSSISTSRQPLLLQADIAAHCIPADRHAIPVVSENEEYMETDDLFEASSQDVLAANAFHCVSFTSSDAQTVEDLIYYRFGFSLNEEPYSGVPTSTSLVPFRNWHEVVCAVGGRTLDSSGRNQTAITHFLGCLISSKTPLRDVPGKFWDLSPDGADPLMQAPTRFIHIIRRHFNNQTWYLLRPRNLHPSRDTSWVIAVDALTALECIRRGLGPHSLDIANYFVDRGIPFLTLARISPTTQIPQHPSYPTTCLLGRRPKGYKFNLADYAAYVTLRDSYLSSQCHARAALCVGGIVARLAREVLSGVVALSGPSQAALDGNQRVLTSNEEHFCDDEISETIADLICGVYHVETGNKGEIIHSLYIHSIKGAFLLRSSRTCVVVPKAKYMAWLWTQCGPLDLSVRRMVYKTS